MEPFTTYEQNQKFSLAMSYGEGISFNNQSAMGLRFCFVYIANGSGILTVDNRQIAYIAPCAFCINETEHIVIPAMEENQIKILYFHPNIINSMMNYVNVRNLQPDISVTFLQDVELIKFFLTREETGLETFHLDPFSAKRIQLLLNRFCGQINDQSIPNWPCRSRSYVLELLFFLDHLSTSESYSSEQYLGQIDEEFYPILLYIYQNYEQKITITDMSEKFGINRTSLSLMFQKNLGESFVSYLNRIRITSASNMLRDTLLPVSEIMDRTGFHDSAHFLRTFKKYNGISPSGYREKYCWM